MRVLVAVPTRGKSWRRSLIEDLVLVLTWFFNARLARALTLPTRVLGSQEPVGQNQAKETFACLGRLMLGSVLLELPIVLLQLLLLLQMLPLLLILPLLLQLVQLPSLKKQDVVHR